VYLPTDRRLCLQDGATELPAVVDPRGREVSGLQGLHGAGQPKVLLWVVAERPDVDGNPGPLGQPPGLPVGCGRHGCARHGRSAPIGYLGVPHGRDIALPSAGGPNGALVVLNVMDT